MDMSFTKIRTMYSGNNTNPRPICPCISMKGQQRWIDFHATSRGRWWPMCWKDSESQIPKVEGQCCNVNRSTAQGSEGEGIRKPITSDCEQSSPVFPSPQRKYAAIF